MNLLRSLINSTDPTVSLKHAAYGATVIFAFGWLTWDMIRGPITAEWNVAFGLLLGAVTVGKVVGPAGSSAPDPVPGMDGGNKC